jgi:cell division protease FtsH
MEPRRRQFSIWYFVATFLVLVAIQSFLSAPHIENVSYSDFKALVRAGKVADLSLTDRVITGRLNKDGLEGILPKERIAELQKFGTGEHRFVTVRVNDPTLVQDLEAVKVRFTGQVEGTWLPTLLSWILPALIFFGLWGFLMKRMGPASGVLEIGKSKGKVYMQKETSVTFADVAGIDEARAEPMEIVEFLKAHQRYRWLVDRELGRPVSVPAYRDRLILA